MKARTVILVLIVAACGVAGGWFAARHFVTAGDREKTAERKVLYYQSPMHPWITSDKPGRCTICGMQLEPVYEGQSGFSSDRDVVMLGSNSIQAINVQTDVVTNRSLVRTLRVAGTIESDATKYRRLSAYANGRIEKLFVNYVGAEVVAGQPLAIMYSPDLLTVENEYLTLLKQGLPAGASENFQRERTRLVQAAAERLRRLGYSEAQLATLATKDSADARTEILAPMTGTVVARNVYEGQYVKEGDLLFETADFNTMWFQFDAYERDLSWIRIGQQVEITSPALSGQVLTAAISFIDPNLNEMTRSAKVRVELPNPPVEDGGRKRRLLYHKMYAEAAVKLATPEVIAVVRTAVLSAGVAVVYVQVGDGAYEQRRVELGSHGDEFVEVIDGLRVGERVVTTGNLIIDAEAQLKATARGGESSSAHTQSETSSKSAAPVDRIPETLSDTQQSSAREFFKLASDLSAALAADNLTDFNRIAPQAHTAIPKLLDALGSIKPLRPALQRLEQDGHLDAAKDIAAARKAFLPFSMAAAELAKQLRVNEPFKTTRIYNCPMVNRAIPGAAKNGQWLQLEAPLRNPFFGAQMLECGTEVKP